MFLKYLSNLLDKRITMKLHLFLTFIFLTFVNYPKCEQGQILDFSDFEQQVNQLEEEGRYQDAIQLTREVWDRFPESEFDLMKEMIYLNEKTGQHEKNLQIWENGHQKGYFFLLSPRIPKYEPYLEYTLFDELVSRDESLRSAAFKESQTIYEVVLPEQYDAQRKYPLLIIFHGGGSNLNRSRNSWKIVSPLDTDFITIYLQSYRCMDSNTYGWLSADERTHQELKGCFDELIEQYPADLSHIYLGGISAGATMALDIALSKSIPVKGVIAFCPGLPRNLTEKSIITTQPKVYILAGENDFYRPKQQELVGIFEKTGIKYKYKIIPGMGHEFPGDYEQILQESLNYVMRP